MDSIPTVAETTENAVYKIDDVVYKDNNVVINYDGISGDEYDYNINFTVENLTEKILAIQISEMSINGYMVDTMCSIEIAPGKKHRMEWKFGQKMRKNIL